MEALSDERASRWRDGCKPFPSDPALEPFPGGFRPGISVPPSLTKLWSVSKGGGILGGIRVHLARGGDRLPPAPSGTFLSAVRVSRPGGRARGPGGGRFLARTASGGC